MHLRRPLACLSCIIALTACSSSGNDVRAPKMLPNAPEQKEGQKKPAFEKAKKVSIGGNVTATKKKEPKSKTSERVKTPEKAKPAPNPGVEDCPYGGTWPGVSCSIADNERCNKGRGCAATHTCTFGGLDGKAKGYACVPSCFAELQCT